MRVYQWFHRCLQVMLILFAPFAIAYQPQFEARYQTFDNQTVLLQDLIGKKPVYLKFWATWCLECRRELPSLEQAYVRHHDKIAMFAVNLNINETDMDIRSLQQKYKLTIPIVMDNNGTIAGNFEFKGTPFHVLINAQGEVVYTTYQDDSALAQQLSLLASDASTSNANTQVSVVSAAEPAELKGVSLVYFSATWCDWYMKDIHPEMSRNCANARQVVDNLYRHNPQLSMAAYVTHLWTEPADVAEYIKKFALSYSVSMDDNNQMFRRFKATQYPTLLILKDDKEIGRYTQFDDLQKIEKEISIFLTEK